jgi:hypothetical protein
VTSYAIARVIGTIIPPAYQPAAALAVSIAASTRSPRRASTWSPVFARSDCSTRHHE